MYRRLLLLFTCLTYAIAEDETFELLLTDLEQLYPEQYPIGYYDRYNLNDMVKPEENQVEVATGGKTDFSEILRSVVFDPNFIPQQQYSDNYNREQYPSLEQL